MTQPPHPATPLLRPLTLVGLMGVGKTSLGKRLAARLGVPFVDSDDEIEAAARCSISDIFARYGEPHFRQLEARVIERLISERTQLVLATGGGAFMNEGTRRLLLNKTEVIWLRAPLAVLVERTSRRANRPLLKQGDPATILAGLMKKRYPVYAEAPLVLDVDERPMDDTVEALLALTGKEGPR